MSLLNRLRSYRIKSRDSHFAWITLLASTSIAVCSVGFNNVYSICFNAFLEKYGESRQKTGELILGRWVEMNWPFILPIKK